MRLSVFIIGLICVAAANIVHAVGIGGQICQFAGKVIQDPDRVEFEKKSGVVICKDESNGVVRTERRYIKGRLTFQKLSYDNGKLESEIEYYANGEVKYEKRGEPDGSYDWLVNNENGSQHGVRRRYFANGKVASESNYDDGTITGKSIDYYESGKIKVLRLYENGGSPVVEIGYREDGQVFDLTCAAKSMLPEDVAPCGFAGKPGVVKRQVSGGGEIVYNYVNGKQVASEMAGTQQGGSSDSTKDGVRTLRDTYPNGKTKRELVRNTNTGEASEKRYAESGQILLDQKGRVDGSMLEATEWYMNGQTKRKTRFEANQSKLIEEFDDNGRLIESGTYDRNDRPLGIHRLYGNTGKVALEVTYEKFRVTRRKEFDASGKLVADDDILEDGSSRPASR
jgi:antitoxin component YwqK of YwqJK toxin-antitoxin module